MRSNVGRRRAEQGNTPYRGRLPAHYFRTGDAWLYLLRRVRLAEAWYVFAWPSEPSAVAANKESVVGPLHPKPRVICHGIWCGEQ